MKITVRVTPNASVNKVVETEVGEYKVYTTANPEAGKANQKVIELLAEFFDVPRSAVTIRFGRTSKEKMVEIEK